MFTNIKERADAIVAKLGKSKRHGSFLEDDTFHGEAQRVLCEGIRSKFTSDELREKNYSKVTNIVEPFKDIKNALNELEDNPNSEEQYNIVIAAQEKIIKEYDRIESSGKKINNKGEEV